MSRLNVYIKMPLPPTPAIHTHQGRHAERKTDAEVREGKDGFLRMCVNVKEHLFQGRLKHLLTTGPGGGGGGVLLMARASICLMFKGEMKKLFH